MTRDVRSLSKEWVETGDDSLLDVLKAGDQDFIDRTFAPRPRIKEGYCSGAEYFEMCFRWGITGTQGQRYRLRAVAEGPFAQHDFTDRLTPSLGESEKASARVARDDSKGSVLVSIAERVEDVERVYFRPISSRVWLEIVDECPSFVRHAFGDLAAPLSVLISVEVDRESPVAARRIGIDHADESADQIVESRSQVVKEFPDHNARLEHHAGGAGNPVHDPCFVCIRIGFQDEVMFCSFDKDPGVFVDSVEMLMRPLDASFNTF